MLRDFGAKMLLLFGVCSMLTACAGKDTKNKGKGDINDVVSVTVNGATYTTRFVTPGDTKGVVVAAGSAVAGPGMPGAAAGAAAVEATSADNATNASCDLTKASNGSKFNLVVNAVTKDFPFSLSLRNAMGPVSGTGLYQYHAPQEAATQKVIANGSYWTEYQQDTTRFSIDSATVNVTTHSGSHLGGSFHLWVSNSGNSKVVDGTFDWQDAAIN